MFKGFNQRRSPCLIQSCFVDLVRHCVVNFWVFAVEPICGSEILWRPAVVQMWDNRDQIQYKTGRTDIRYLGEIWTNPGFVLVCFATSSSTASAVLGQIYIASKTCFAYRDRGVNGFGGLNAFSMVAMIWHHWHDRKICTGKRPRLRHERLISIDK